MADASAEAQPPFPRLRLVFFKYRICCSNLREKQHMHPAVHASNLFERMHTTASSTFTTQYCYFLSSNEKDRAKPLL